MDGVTERLTEYRAQIAGTDPGSMLAWAASTFGSQNLAFATSLGAEDQVLTDLISGLSERIPVFTLDTGRLFQETYDLIERVRSRYAIDVAVYAPEAGHVEEMVHTHGPNLFYNSVELRKRCCHVRKVLPLQRALAGRVAWITGLRRDQSVTRSALEPIEWDEARGLFKLAPLASWSEEQVWSHIRTHDVPYHKLHDQGFRSIGCAPCTRAVGPDEDVRAGRWWWEHPAKKECGLHAR